MDRQHIQLALPWRGSSCDQIGTMMSTMPNDDTPSVRMCPRLYRAVRESRPIEEVAALLLQQHGAATNHTGCFGKIGKGRILDIHSSRGSSKYGIIQHDGWCDIREVTDEGNTVLHVAAEKGYSELIQELHHKFREEVKDLLSRRNSALDTPLHCAARAGSDTAVTVLVKLAKVCGESNLLGGKNEAGDTALHLAARHGHVEVVKALVSASAAEAADENKVGASPLYLAVMSGSVKAVKEIIDKCRGNASYAGPASQNALHAAVFQSSKMVDILMEWSPDLASKDDDSGSSPLHYASSDGDCKVVEAILRAAPPEAVYKKDKAGLSALHVAARMGHRRVVKALLERRPDAAELRDKHGRTFVHAAAAEGRSPVVSLAIERFRDSSKSKLRGLLDAQDKEGNTPLHLAVAKGASGVVDALLQKGKVRVDVLNNDGHTPLDLAANSKSYLTMVSLVVTLVAFKASPQPKRQDHLEPWSISAMKKGIEKSCDNLVVVAVLIATVAFAAGFNVPGGFAEKTGKANLRKDPAFVCFLFLDTLAVVTSVAAAILLVYSKASCSSGSWKSFVASLHCMWASLISLMLAFDAALIATGTSCSSGLKVVRLCVQVLIVWITMCVAPATSWLTNLRFLWQLISRPKGRHVVQRQYPFAGAFIPNLLLFMLTNFMAFIGFSLISFLYSVEKYVLEKGKI
ncbi:unnamed protein product [Urochloa decumbens]|uniref:PGG domain-containing protein n=1 Tax=Urochloa decumbens TaxID=240449 RepID=A0ABC9B5Q9_9POAL